jgi:major membrane immunogen (membrane-anchored lipoprotein)
MTMKTAALMLAALLLVSCEKSDPKPAPSGTSANYVEHEPRYDDGKPM